MKGATMNKGIKPLEEVCRKSQEELDTYNWIFESDKKVIRAICDEEDWGFCLNYPCRDIGAVMEIVENSVVIYSEMCDQTLDACSAVLMILRKIRGRKLEYYALVFDAYHDDTEDDYENFKYNPLQMYFTKLQLPLKRP